MTKLETLTAMAKLLLEHRGQWGSATTAHDVIFLAVTDCADLLNRCSYELCEQAVAGLKLEMAADDLVLVRAENHAAHSRVFSPKWDGRDTFTIEEACEILGVSRPTGYQAANNGSLPVIRFGKRWIVPRHALQKMLEVTP